MAFWMKFFLAARVMDVRKEFISTQCLCIQTQALDQQLTTNLYTNNAIIFPGTKWCGLGNIARSYEDLGEFKEADACCRNHDHCPDSIGAGKTKYGLTNYMWYSKMLCDCDMKFKDCLEKNTGIASRKIKVLYFNLFQPQCFKEDYPSKCVDFWFFLLRCKTYEKDTSSAKVFQLIDNPPVYEI